MRDDTIYMLIAIDKEYGDRIFTGKMSTLSWIKTWIKRYSSVDAVKERFDFTWKPITSIDEDYLALFKVMECAKR